MAVRKGYDHVPTSQYYPRCGRPKMDLDLGGWWSRGQTDIYGLFCELVAPPRTKTLGYYFQLGTCLGASEIHVLLSFLWSAFFKWHVINVTLLSLKIVVLKIQD